MRNIIKTTTLYLLTIIWVAAGGISCVSLDNGEFHINYGADIMTPTERDEHEESRKALIIYSNGYNNLSNDLQDDIEDIACSYIPGTGRSQNLVFVYSHQTSKKGNYSIKTSPTLVRFYKFKDELIRDTLVVYPEGTNSSSKETIRDVLSYIQTNYPAKGYGLLMSSHGTGWAPEGYCSDPGKYGDFSGSILLAPQQRQIHNFHAELDPLTKSIGSQFNGSYSITLETDITDLAEAIPMKLDYIVFDACFMGGVEVAYELKDVCRYIIGSQTEILASGMDYNQLTRLLIGEEEADLQACAKAYYDMYANEKMVEYRSATVSLVDCQKLDNLAAVCKNILANHRTDFEDLQKNKRSSVQHYFRMRYEYQHGLFYDMRSIFTKIGASEEELSQFDKSLNDCIICKYATPTFMSSSFEIKEHSGLSMYLPEDYRKYANTFYTKLKWNQAVELIK